MLPVHESQEDSARAAATATAAVQQAVLASVQAALPHLHQEARAQLLAAVAQLSDRLPLKSSVKAACLRLQHQLFRSYVLAGAGGQGWEQDQVRSRSSRSSSSRAALQSTTVTLMLAGVVMCTSSKSW